MNSTQEAKIRSLASQLSPQAAEKLALILEESGDLWGASLLYNESSKPQLASILEKRHYQSLTDLLLQAQS